MIQKEKKITWEIKTIWILAAILSSIGFYYLIKTGIELWRLTG